MKPVFTISVSKKDAKRLMFFFSVKVAIKGWSGRTYGKHSISPTIWEDANGGQHPKNYERHYFGRSVRSMPTTNGCTVNLEWSLGCQHLRQEDAVIIQLFKGNGNTWLFRIAPHRALGKVGEDGRWHLMPWETRPTLPCIPITIIKETNRVRFKFGAKEWDVRRTEITPNAFSVWDNDLWKYDWILKFCEHTNKIVAYPGSDFVVHSTSIIEEKEPEEI